jgi:murein DD-endopeptidase MepM/ murein hydrolase activator NlpD
VAGGEDVVGANSHDLIVADYRKEARRAAQRYGLDPHIFERQIQQESGFNPTARSGAGAVGIAQIMPGTAKGWGVNPLDPIASLNAAAKNMASYVKKYGGYENALRAYNAGPGAIERSKGFAETNAYVRTILGGRDPGQLGSPVSSPSSSTTPTGSPSVAPASTAPPTIAGGQAGDFTSLLASLLTKPEQQQQAPAPIAPPSFAAHPVLPQGFSPASSIAPPPVPAQDRTSQALGLVGALAGTGATVGQGAGPTTSIADAVMNQPKGIADAVTRSRSGAKVSPHAQAGDPVVSSHQSVGGLHETAGLAGYPAHDFMAPAGSHAVAPVSGTVVRLSGHDPKDGPTNGPHGPFGYSVYIKGDDGKSYYLTHMGSRDVQAGDKVTQGQIIGTVGNYKKWGGADHIHMGVSG